MSDELKPCPFCGGVHVEIVNQGSRPDDPHVVQCDDCDASASGMSVGEAIAAWNRRAERTCQIVVSVDRNPASYGGMVHRCSSCRKALPGSLFRNGWIKLDYCPRCGARVTEMVRDAD